MKVIIPAAGQGKRIPTYSKVVPKPLIKLGKNKTLLEVNLKRISSSGIASEVIIITGYKAKKIEKHVKNIDSSLKIKTIFNKHYQDTNPLISLWTAREEMEKNDFIIINGDTIFASKVYKKVTKEIKKHKKGIWMVLSKDKTFVKDDVKVKILNKKVKEIGKNISKSESKYVSSGFVILKGRKRKEFFSFLKKRSKRKGFLNSNLIWHDVLADLVKKGGSINFIKIKINDWQEVDTLSDLILARTLK